MYKRALDVAYNLKMKASRAVFHEINTKAPALPFALRTLTEGEGDKARDLGKQLRLGLVECLNHGLLQPYPVLHEKAGDIVAQVRLPRGAWGRQGGQGRAVQRVEKVLQLCPQLDWSRRC